MRDGGVGVSGSSGGAGSGLQEVGASSLDFVLQQPNAAQLMERQRGALVDIDHNSSATGDAAAGDAAGGQAAETASADSAANQAAKQQTEPEQQAAALAAASEPVEVPMGVQMEQAGQEGQGG